MSGEAEAIDAEFRREDQPKEGANVIALASRPRDLVVWTPDQLRAKIAREEEIRSVLKEHVMERMVPGQHYYWLSDRDRQKWERGDPNAPKPSLSKPGAQNLCELFSCVVEWIPSDVQTVREGGDHITVTATVRIRSIPTGEIVAFGTGVCSTRESKYAYRWVKEAEIPPQLAGEIDLNRVPIRPAPWDQRVTLYRVPNPDVPDQWNTVTKMGLKRAVVDASLKLPLVSELFTQDLEDLSGDGAGASEETGEGRARQGRGKTKGTPAAGAPAGVDPEIARVIFATKRGKTDRSRSWSPWWATVRKAAQQAKVEQYVFIGAVVSREVKTAKDLTDAEYVTVYRQALEIVEGRNVEGRAAPAPPASPSVGPQEEAGWQKCEVCDADVSPEAAQASFEATGQVLCGPDLEARVQPASARK